METYNVVRGITGVGEGNGPMIVFHDGFVKAATNVSQGGWDGFMPGGDRVAIDQHPYLCFAQPNIDGLSYQAAKVCFTIFLGDPSEEKLIVISLLLILIALRLLGYWVQYFFSTIRS